MAPTTLAEFRILPGVVEAARRLKEAGFLLVVATNQPDVRNGITAKAAMEAMHDEIRARMPIDDIMICLHNDADHCACRKPKPGLLLEAAAKHGIDLKSSYFVGDRWKDVHAGQAAGCSTVFVDYGYRQDQPCGPDCTVSRSPRRQIIFCGGISRRQQIQPAANSCASPPAVRRFEPSYPGRAYSTVSMMPPSCWRR